MNIVFVYFGSRLPEYLIANLDYHAETFPREQIWLVTNLDLNSNLKINTKVNFFRLEDYMKPNVVNAIFGDLQGDIVKFRDGYWQRTTSRILALADFQKINEKPLVHVEGDVILLPHFPFERFGSVKSVAFPLVNRGYGCASVLFSPHSREVDALKSFFVQNLTENNRLNDMEMLGKYQSCYAKKVTILPSVSTNRNEFQDWVTEEEIQLLTRNLREFGGIFDGMTIGQYLLGEDPNNHFGIRLIYRIQKHHSFNPRASKFSWHDKELQISSKSEPLSVFALHVHSKDMRAFKHPTNLDFIKSRILSDRKKLKREPIPSLILEHLPSLIKIKSRWLARKLFKATAELSSRKNQIGS
jgi:hypothetical protein